MRAVRTVLVGVAAQTVLLAFVAAVVGIGARGWAVGFAAGLLANVWLVHQVRAAGSVTIGPANVVTLGRAMVVAAVAALVTDAAEHRLPLTPTLALAALAMSLDCVDGQVARRTASVSKVGARFDGEVDAFLILVLSIAVARPFGPWVLAIGLWRYAFGFAGCFARWLRGPLPTSYWGKTVAVVQGLTLMVALPAALPHGVMFALLVASLVLLTESFCHAIWWLWSQRPTATEPGRRRRAAGRVATVLAVVITWAALVAPDRLSQLTWTTFLRLPIEGIVLVALALVLPGRGRRFAALMAGVALAGLVVLRTLDMGFFSVLDRPFNPITDWSSLGPALGVLIDSIGRTRAILLATGAGAVMLAVVVAITAATVRVTRVAVRHRHRTAQTLVALGVAWTLLAVAVVTTGAGAPAAARSAAAATSAEVGLVRAGLRDQHTFDSQLASVDPVSLESASGLLTGLRGKDVLLVFIESYGRVAVQDSSIAPQVDALLRAGTTSLSAAGFSTRSAFLTSPTFGGGSWFAHSTVQSGLWISNEGRYEQLVASRRFTLSQAFERAGWHTVFDLPATARAWPEGAKLYHFDTLYDATNVGYKGPRFSFARIPDQYTLQVFGQRELEPRHPPVFGEIVLDSSHAPWAPLPHMVAWQDLGDGTVFDPMPFRGPTPVSVLASSERARAAYGQSIQYTLTALIQFLQRSDDKNLVVLAVGDHQPATIVSGDNAGHDVPVMLFARDQRVIDATSSWGWQDGLLPSPAAPVWPMDTLRNRLLSTFGPQSARVVHAGGSHR